MDRVSFVLLIGMAVPLGYYLVAACQIPLNLHIGLAGKTILLYQIPLIFILNAFINRQKYKEVVTDPSYKYFLRTKLEEQVKYVNSVNNRLLQHFNRYIDNTKRRQLEMERSPYVINTSGFVDICSMGMEVIEHKGLYRLLQDCLFGIKAMREESQLGFAQLKKNVKLRLVASGLLMTHVKACYAKGVIFEISLQDYPSVHYTLYMITARQTLQVVSLIVSEENVDIKDYTHSLDEQEKQNLLAVFPQPLYNDHTLASSLDAFQAIRKSITQIKKFRHYTIPLPKEDKFCVTM